MDIGQRAIAIDEVPLEWCMNPGVKLDFRHFEDGYVATSADVEAELKRIGHELRPLNIVVVNTSADARYGQPDFVDAGCGIGRKGMMLETKWRCGHSLRRCCGSHFWLHDPQRCFRARCADGRDGRAVGACQGQGL